MIKYIGISGLARAGKNIFCDIAIKQLKEEYNLKAKSYALAFELKKDCAEFVNSKLGLDVFTENTENKNIFRPLLVWYAHVKRTQSMGRYWIEQLNNTIKNDNNMDSDIILISDIRFAEYPKDEIFWLRHELNGKLIHISKFSYDVNNNKIFNKPPNETERLNDPKIKKDADYLIEWESSNGDNLINNIDLNQHVRKCLKSILQ